MGFLHQGHLSLMEKGKSLADRLVVSLFVNPTQFGPNEDLAAYPMDEARDLELTQKAGVDAVFIPDVQHIYPSGYQTVVSLKFLSGHLCGLLRPGHFDGVATVVTKLLGIVRPHLAVFGEKDFQQLKVVTRMARDLSIPTAVIGVPTVRADNGLALSSRNEYLSDEERTIAPLLHQTLQDLATAIRAGKNISRCCNTAKRRLKSAGFKPDYVEARVAQTLAPATSGTETELRILAACWLGKTRLIDNIAV